MSQSAPADHLEPADHDAARSLASRLGLRHRDSHDELAQRWTGTPFGHGEHQRVRNVVEGTVDGREVVGFDYSFFTSKDDAADEFDRRALHHFTVCAMTLAGPVPQLAAVVTDTNEWEPATVAGVRLDVAEDFSRRYAVDGRDAAFAQAVLTEDNVAALLGRHKRTDWRFDGATLLGWARDQKCGHDFDDLARVLALLAASAERAVS